MNYATVFLLAAHQHAWPKEASDLVLGIVCSECDGDYTSSNWCTECGGGGTITLIKQDAIRGQELGLWKLAWVVDNNGDEHLEACLPHSHVQGGEDFFGRDIVFISRELQIAAREYYHMIKMVEALLDK